MSSSEINGIIVVTVGLPGAGKSTLCHALMTEMAKSQVISRLVSYDEELNDRHSWNQADFSWKSERQILFEDISKWLAKATQEKDGKSIWLMVDDNMYYRSMRYPYFQLAREHKMAFAQLFISCPLDTVLRQNQLRTVDQVIPLEVIERMNTRLQEPSPEENAWEKWTIFVDGTIDNTQSTAIEKILKKLDEASQTPAPPLTVVDYEEKERQRQMTKDSLLYQADLMLRRVVSDYCKNAKDVSGTKPQGELLRDVKRRILEKMRSGCIDLNLVARQDMDSMRILFADFYAAENLVHSLETCSLEK